MILWDGSKVSVYVQAPGQYVFNQMLTVDEYVTPPRQTKEPLCTILNGGFNASRPQKYVKYPEIWYGLNDDGRVVSCYGESPTLIPCYAGNGYDNISDIHKSNYGKMYWMENKSDNFI